MKSTFTVGAVVLLLLAMTSCLPQPAQAQPPAEENSMVNNAAEAVVVAPIPADTPTSVPSQIPEPTPVVPGVKATGTITQDGEQAVLRLLLVNTSTGSLLFSKQQFIVKVGGETACNAETNSAEVFCVIKVKPVTSVTLKVNDLTTGDRCTMEFPDVYPSPDGTKIEARCVYE